MTEEELLVLRRQLGNELTEAAVYAALAKIERDPKNRETLENIGRAERRHAVVITDILGGELGHPNLGKAWRIVLSARIFGLTFALRYMETGESKAGPTYRRIEAGDARLAQIAADEDAHELALIGILKDERLTYMGAMVYGLNDALVELTGSLAGFTLALSGAREIAMIGLIAGCAAGMSMAAAAYLSAKADADKTGLSPLKSAAYTAVAYFITVVLLILPYLFVANVFLALGLMLAAAVVVIALFTFYISVAKGTKFLAAFTEMLAISGTVAAISFGIGYALNRAFGV